ncbi:hypothetical protein ACXZ1K_13600 [Pedobacter sp. PWIIR3]
MFFINCIVGSIITYWIFTSELSNQSKMRYGTWTFNLQDTVYRIDKSNEYNEFSMSYSNGGGTSTEFMTGHYAKRNDTLQLKADSITMYIHDLKLYNFRKSRFPIKLKIDQ